MLKGREKKRREVHTCLSGESAYEGDGKQRQFYLRDRFLIRCRERNTRTGTSRAQVGVYIPRDSRSTVCRQRWLWACQETCTHRRSEAHVHSTYDRSQSSRQHTECARSRPGRASEPGMCRIALAVKGQRLDGGACEKAAVKLAHFTAHTDILLHSSKPSYQRTERPAQESQERMGQRERRTAEEKPQKRAWGAKVIDRTSKHT